MTQKKDFLRIIRTSLLVNLILASLSGCHYLPLVQYHFPPRKAGFPRFNEKQLFRGTIHSLRSCYDVVYYDWHITPDPEQKSLSGKMIIRFKVKEAADSLLLDLHDRMQVTDLTSDFSEVTFSHKRDLLYIFFKDRMRVGDLLTLQVTYKGKPVSFGKNGPVVWARDSLGNHWVSTTTEGIGPSLIMPCKDLLYDEPDSCFIRLTVPAKLAGIANGKLDSITTLQGYKTYHWAVRNPINVYNISFNIGDFVKIEKEYPDITGSSRVIDIYALSYDREKAGAFYDQVPMVMRHLETLNGMFPWWNDGCKFIQSALTTSMMEHQSGISMGDLLTNDLTLPGKPSVNTTLIHELAHEWWGNNLSASDYCDIWLHEGLATYSEALVAERIYGRETMDWMVAWFMHFSGNKRPVIKPCDVKYNSWASEKDDGIYYKGAVFIHTLRMQLENDPLFFSILKETQVRFNRSIITTDEFMQFFNERSGIDFTPYFDLYLKNSKVPELVYSFNEETGELSYKWAEKLPDGLKMKIIVRDDSAWVPLYPTDRISTYKISSPDERLIRTPDFGYVELKKVEKAR